MPQFLCLHRLLPFIFLFLFFCATPTNAIEWTQDAGNAQRTGYTSEEPQLPWTYAWSFNGPDAQGGAGNHFYDAGRSSTLSVTWEGRTVLGGGKIYVPALQEGLYALNKDTGAVLWNMRSANFKATPAYDPATRMVFAGASNGTLYKVNADSGQVAGTYSAGSPLNKSVLLADGFAYVTSENGSLHKVSMTSMTQSWVYQGNSGTSTPPAFSPSRSVIIYATKDLYVHAVNVQNGAQKWRVKPSTVTASTVLSFDGTWPVISESHGIVFVRMNLGLDGLYGAPGFRSTFPTTNAETRTFLQTNPRWKNLFALNLDTGTEKFIPAVGSGGVEGLVNDGPQLWPGSLPALKPIAGGKEVAYMVFRNSQTTESYIDFRNESHMGEMVLDDTTVSGYVAGDLRFVQYDSGIVRITDEQSPISLAGNVIFYSHWGALETAKVTDRSSSRGATIANKITTTKYPSVIRRIKSCADFNPSTHRTTCGLELYQDGKYWPGPGFWVYWNIMDPPTPVRGAYSEGLLPRYTYASEGVIVIEGNGGELFVMKPSGTTTTSPTPQSSPTPTATSVTCNEDINQDRVVDLSDYSVLVVNFLKATITTPRADINRDGVVDLSDYSLLAVKFLRAC